MLKTDLNIVKISKLKRCTWTKILADKCWICHTAEFWTLLNPQHLRMTTGMLCAVLSWSDLDCVVRKEPLPLCLKARTGFNPFPNKPWILRVCSRCLLKTLWEKEKLHVTSNFSFSHSVFYSVGELYAIFIEFIIVVCKLFLFGRV